MSNPDLQPVEDAGPAERAAPQPGSPLVERNAVGAVRSGAAKARTSDVAAGPPIARVPASRIGRVEPDLTRRQAITTGRPAFGPRYRIAQFAMSVLLLLPQAVLS